MDNNGFSYLFRLGHSTSSAPHPGESQPEQTVEQEQQPTFSGRLLSSYDPENPYLASLDTGPAAYPSASASSVTSSTAQHFPAIGDPANPFFLAIDRSQPIAPSEPCEDAFAALASYVPISFEDDLLQLSGDFGDLGNFGSFDEFLNTYLPIESEPQKRITSQPAMQTTSAPVMDSPVIFNQGAQTRSQSQPGPSTETVGEAAIEETTEQISHVSGSFLEDLLEDLLEDPQETQQVSGQDNPPASYQGDKGTAALAEVLDISATPLASDNQMGEFHDPQIISKVARARERKNTPYKEFYWYCDSEERPYICGYPECGRTFKWLGNLTDHMFDHRQTSKHRCTYPECGSSKYFRRSRDLKRHIEKVHTPNPDRSGVEQFRGRIIGKVKRLTKYKNTRLEQFFLRTDSEERPYMCGYPDCGKTFKWCSHLTDHMFDHAKTSEHKCNYPECGPNKYFRRRKDLKRHIEKVHTPKVGILKGKSQKHTHTKKQ